MTITHLLWDHDGVLVDTEYWYFEATRLALAEWNIILTQDGYMQHMVDGASSWRAAEEAGYSEQQIIQQRDYRNSLYQQFLGEKDIEIEGVEDVLAELSRQFKMAIVTTSRRVDFELIHQHRHICDHMDFVLTVEDYPRAKPEADPYLAALDRFGISRDQALVIEDSRRGLSAALAAQIPCVMVYNNFTEAQDFSGALTRISTLAEMPALLDKLNQN